MRELSKCVFAGVGSLDNAVLSCNTSSGELEVRRCARDSSSSEVRAGSGWLTRQAGHEDTAVVQIHFDCVNS